MTERISTQQIYRAFNQSLFDNQVKLVEASNKVNTGINFKNNYDDPRASSLSVDFEGQILNNNSIIKNRFTSQTNLELAEDSLAQMKDNMDKVKEILLTATNATADSSSLNTFKTEIRSIGTSLIQLSNIKSGKNYIFSGEQSNLKTFDLQDPNQSFSKTIYKNGLDNGRQKNFENIQSTFDIKDAMLGTGLTASIQGIKVNPNINAPGGNLDLVINNGTGSQKSFTVNLAAGDNLSTIITKINTAFNTAGGVGSIAEENPTWQLKLNTGLITGNSLNSNAKIEILKTSSNNILDDTGISINSATGQDLGALYILDQIETALSNGDKTTLRSLIKKVDDNVTILEDTRSKIGLTLNKVENLNSINQNFDTLLQSGLSRVRDADFIDASSALSNAQARLNSSIQTASSFFKSNLSNFLGG